MNSLPDGCHLRGTNRHKYKKTDIATYTLNWSKGWLSKNYFPPCFCQKSSYSDFNGLSEIS